MTQEEKAKAYDEAVERAKEAASNGYVSQNFVSDIFPELKESEGERIRKKLVQFFKEKDEEDFEEWVPKAKVLAWIEEQGEHANFRNKIQIGDKVTRNEDGVLVNLSQLNRVAKKQGEEKPVDKVETNLLTVERAKEISPFMRSGFENESADKVEPKFHKGDWVVYCNDDVDLITGIEENGYCINNSGYIPFVCASDVRLWTIQDAKDGDVLVSESTCGLGTWYCIFKSLDGDESMTVHCYIGRDGRFQTMEELCFNKDPRDVKPATKEQRDTLEKAMTDAGYTFDFEKKELKKIEQKTADLKTKAGNWYICDMDVVNENMVTAFRRNEIYYCPKDGYLDVSGALFEVGGLDAFRLATEKEITQPQPKQEWSEEDEKEVAVLEAYIRSKDWSERHIDRALGIVDELVNKVKSIRPQSTWKPSDEMLEALGRVIPENVMEISEDEILLAKLYQGLKYGRVLSKY